MRFIGLDVHRDFCDVAIYEDGEVRSAGRVESSPEQLELLGQSLGPDDQVALETTGNALKIARILERHVGGRPRRRHAQRARDDPPEGQERPRRRPDAGEAARRGNAPRYGLCDEPTRVLRRRISRRNQLVRGRTRARNQVHAVLIRNLGGRAPGRNTFANRAVPGLRASTCPLMSASCLRAACGRQTS